MESLSLVRDFFSSVIPLLLLCFGCRLQSSQRRGSDARTFMTSEEVIVHVNACSGRSGSGSYLRVSVLVGAR